MFKVIIADDEVRLCRLVQMLADWESLDMEVVGTASNGFEALALIETLAPDILISDIRMPGCDGLELIEKAKQIAPELEIIIISGYAQFEYAQTAIRQGVGGYLLKPIKKEALMTTLENIGNHCKERAASHIAMDNLKQDKLRSHDLLRNQLMEDLLRGQYHAKTIEQLERDYGFAARDELLQVFILKTDYDAGGVSDLSLSHVKKKIEELFAADILPLCAAGTLHFRGSSAYGILNYAPGQYEDVRHALRQVLNHLEAQKFLFGNICFSLAIGSAVKSAEHLSTSMHEACDAICERLVEGTGRLLEFTAPTARDAQRQVLDKYHRAVHHAVETLSCEEADLAANEIAREINQSTDVRGCEILELVLAAGRMFALLMNAREEGRLTLEFERRCDLCSSAQKLFDCLQAFQREQIESADAQRVSETTRPIRIAKQYIHAHFNEPITLEDVCAATGFSVSYFSTMFKKETGEGFSKYLTRVRIEHAKTLLQDTDFSVSEICAQVGYGDLKHFTGTFKKNTNLNPGQYRKLYG